MLTANIISVLPTTYNGRTFIQMSSDSIDASSSNVIELIIPAINTNDMTYRTWPKLNYADVTLAMEVFQIKIDNSSTSFNFWLFNKLDDDFSTLKNTIYECYTPSLSSYYIDKFFSTSFDSNFDSLLIRNYNDTIDNHYYLYIENSDLNATGDINIELIYRPIHTNNF